MLLHLLVLAPFVAAILMAATSKEDPKSSSRLAFIFGLAFVVLSVMLIAAGNKATDPIEWFRIPGCKGPVYYYLYSHGLGAWMVFLSTALSLVALVSARVTACKNYRNFAIGIFSLMGAMNGTFLAADAVLFFFFFEAMVIPAAILIASYGGKESSKAAMTFAIYTLVGSAPMMVALLLAFLVKTPVFPFHGWQAITYAEAPAPLSAILTGAMSKAGVFGFIAWILPIFPLNMSIVSTMMWLGLATAVYGALMALRATDGKKLLAFSSMSHLGIAVAGVFSLSEAMLPAVLVLLVAHGLCAGAQFFLMGIAERMAGTRELDKLGGLSGNSPVFSTLFGALGVMSLAVPGTAGFVGEFTVLLSLWDMGPFAALVMGFSMILSAAYMLRFIQKVIFGKASGSYDNGPRTSGLEGASIGIMAVLLLVFGFHPAFVTDSLHLFDEETVEQMNDAGKAADGEEAAETDEDADEDELPQAMTPDEIAQLDSSLKANGFTDEERKSLITQVVGAEAALALESRVQAGLDAEASDDAKTNDEALNKEASND